MSEAAELSVGQDAGTETMPDQAEAGAFEPVRKLRYAEADGRVELGLEMYGHQAWLAWLEHQAPRRTDFLEAILYSDKGNRFLVQDNVIYNLDESESSGQPKKVHEFKTRYELATLMVPGSSQLRGNGSEDRIVGAEVPLRRVRRSAPDGEDLSGYQYAGPNPFDEADNLIANLPAEPARSEEPVTTPAAVVSPTVTPDKEDDTAEPPQPTKPPESSNGIHESDLREPPRHHSAPDKIRRRAIGSLIKLWDKVPQPDKLKRRRKLAVFAAVTAMLGAGIAIGALVMDNGGKSPSPHIGQPPRPDSGTGKSKPKKPQPHRGQNHSKHEIPSSVRLAPGSNPWVVAEQALRAYGYTHPSNPQIWAYDLRILQLNNLDEEDARHLPVGMKLRLPQL
jgi:hypothetical protein